MSVLSHGKWATIMVRHDKGHELGWHITMKFHSKEQC